MNLVIILLENFLEKRITAFTFRLKFLDLWRELRDEQYRAEAQEPELKNARMELFAEHLRGEISSDDFLTRYRPLAEELYKDCRIKAFSREEEILGQLFDAIESNTHPDLAPPGDIGEANIFEAARQALFALQNSH
jgi:hypothetical protein